MMSEYRIGKKDLYFRVFDFLNNQYESISHINIRDVINNQLSSNNLPSFQYDSDLTDILIDYVKSQILTVKEQNLILIINKLVQEKLVLNSNVNQLINVKRKQILLNLYQKLKIIDKDNLIPFLYEQYPNTTSILDLYEQIQSDIQNLKKIKLESEEYVFINSLHQKILILIDDYDRNENNIKENQKIMNIQEQSILLETYNLEFLLNQIYEKEKLNQNNYMILIEEEVNLIKLIVSEMNLKQLLGLDKILVQPFGSIISGFSQNESDIDISINTNCYLDERVFLTLIFTFMKNYFNKQQIYYSRLELIEKAHIPLIKLVKKNEKLEGENKTVQIDICINNVLGCTNSIMLNIISKIHPLIPKLGVVIKKWAKNKELIGLRKLSSYSFILIMINFLQKQKYIDNQFQLMMEACFSENKYQTQIKRKKESEEEFQTSLYCVQKASILSKSLNIFKENNPNQTTILDVDLSTLFKEFINYYCDTSGVKRYINILSETMPNNFSSNYFFYIIDPLDKKHNPGHRSKVENIENNIYINVFRQTNQLLNNRDYKQIF